MPQILHKKKNNSTETETVTLPHKVSAHGAVPFMRFLMVMGVSLVIFVICSILSYFTSWFFHQPTALHTPSDTLSWMASSMIIPYIINFIASALFTMYIITQSSLSYTWWVIKQGWMILVLYFFIVCSVSVILVGVVFSSIHADEDNYSGSFSNVPNTIMVLSMGMSVFVAWMGYRASWKIFRAVGAQTMQQRYESDLAHMEVQHSGRWWDKYVSSVITSLTGRDGEKPRGFVIYAFVCHSLVILSASLVIVLKLHFLLSLSVIVVPCCMVSLCAAIAKYRDGRYKKNTAPVLVPVRNKDTEDTYNPASKGIHVFHR